MNGSENANRTRTNRWLIGLILLGLFIWGGIMAWGVIRNQTTLDLRKPLVILGVFAIFVFAWLGLLSKRNRNS